MLTLSLVLPCHYAVQRYNNVFSFFRGDGEFIPNDLRVGGVTNQLQAESGQSYLEFTPRVLLLTG